ncbi:MAG: HmuY family protein [Bacteroidota bacterium]
MMKNRNLFWSLAILGVGSFGMMACEPEVMPEVPVELTVKTAVDIPADPEASRTDPPNFTFYDLDEGVILTKEDSTGTAWDIALAGTTILTNGGVSGPGQGSALIVDGIFDSMEEAPTSGFSTDNATTLAIPTGSGNGWYTYTAGTEPTNSILPIPGKVIVLTTGEGNYAMIEILSYYKGNPDTTTPEFASFDTRPDGRYYTFRYVVQPDGTNSF